MRFSRGYCKQGGLVIEEESQGFDLFEILLANWIGKLGL